MKKKYTVVGIGEVLWDLLPNGKILGGAPVNFAYHAAQLGADGVAISSVGNDELGREIVDSVNEKGIVNCISFNSHPTGTVGVKLIGGKPDYTIYENVAWDFIELTPESFSILQQADAICFGTLAQRNNVSHQAIMSALKLVPEKCLRVYDINLRQKFYSRSLVEDSLAVSNVFKINDVEISQLIIDAYSLEYLALTKGEKGSYLFHDNEISYLQTPVVDVEDTIGAGDSFTAAMVMGILNNLPLKEIHRKAVDISAYVCTQKGACLLYTSDAADEEDSVDLGGRRIIK